MTVNPLTTNPSVRAEDARNFKEKEHLHCLLVMHNGSLIGVLKQH